MKKFQLTISTPCHESWEEMSEQERGRFCASCQKTVVDFTGMSDSQLVQFFRNSGENVCGRLHPDQLDRELVPPSRRLPWFRYFLQLTWPAFMLFLKSCGNRESIMGKMNVKLTTVKPTVLGELVAPQIQAITPPDSLSSIKIKSESSTIGSGNKNHPPQDRFSFPRIENEILQETEKNEQDSMPFPVKAMDTVSLFAYNSRSLTGIVGGISMVYSCDINKEKIEIFKNSSPDLPETSSYKIYPNPVKAGSLITVSLNGPENMPELVQLINNSGQLIMSVKMDAGDASVFNVRIPSSIQPGLYFLRMIKSGGRIPQTEKIFID